MRTISELQDSLDSDLAWRRSELHSYLGSVRRSSRDSVTQRSLCRAGIPLLYAHWEGYAKHSLSAYIQFVGRRRLTYRELHPGFVALGIEAEADAQAGISATRKMIWRAHTLLTKDGERAAIPWRKGVDTQSNLNSNRCFELFALVGLDASPIQLKSRLIDYELLRVRNEIAHGQYLNVDSTAYEELHQEVLTILNFVRNAISTAAENGAYRRDAVPGFLSSADLHT
ncbi:MAE_28990/MAE_18760 family HEPN-like nuclease [Streptomyces anthocyanicus]|uniref:MAE_28990/MAE_18760 family HEPN-like nuclease n=1 Tax=Streptomyces anthocyanicus TaxID=68174 RepID=UPI0038B45679